MLVSSQIGKKGGDINTSILLELLKSMIDSCQSFLGNVISNILNKLTIDNAVGTGEAIFDGSDLLRGQKDSSSVE
jgi:hypothetical protein